jgi:hypothetical protein
MIVGCHIILTAHTVMEKRSDRWQRDKHPRVEEDEGSVLIDIDQNNDWVDAAGKVCFFTSWWERLVLRAAFFQESRLHVLC